MNRGTQSWCSADIVGLIGRKIVPLAYWERRVALFYRAQSASTLNGRMKYRITNHQVITSDMGRGDTNPHKVYLNF